MQQNAPVPGQAPPGGAPPNDGKTAKQRKKEEAERQKRLQAEKRRQLELNVQVNSFNRAISNSVMDIPTMYRYASNTLKSMLVVDHVAIASFEEIPEIRQGIICVGKAEASLPKTAKPAAPAPPKPKDKKAAAAAAAQKKKDEDKEPPKVLPKFPVAPKEPPKPGTVLPLENIIWDMPLVYKIRDVKQPAMIPDASKFPDPEVQKFAGIYRIRSMLFIPVTVVRPGKEEGEEPEEEVVGVVLALTVNEFKALTPTEINFAGKAIHALARAVDNAPPDLPMQVKRQITRISKDPTSDRLISYYSSIFDDFFDVIEYELGTENLTESFKKVKEEAPKILEQSKLKKVWFQMYELVKSEGEAGSIARRCLQEAYSQAFEFTKAKGVTMPVGLKGIRNYVAKNTEFSELKDLGIDEEVIFNIEEQVDDAIRGKSLFTDKVKATLVNDVEQSNMLMNYISAPAAVDFRNHIQAAFEDTEVPSIVEKELLMDDMCYYGLAEVSRSICQDLVEKVLFELPEYLEQPQEKQTEQSEALVLHFHRKIMANLTVALKGKKSAWINYIRQEMRNRAKEAAKKRAVMVGKINREEEEEEEYY